MGVRHLPHGPGRTPGEQGDRFPGFDVLREIPTWDVVTAGVVLARLGPPPALRFFEPTEEAVARALLDQILDQRDEPRVPVLEMIDARLAEAETDGWRYDNMPPDGEAWRRSLRALDEDAWRLHGTGFAALDWATQSLLVQEIQGHGDETWHGMQAARVWSLWTRYAATAFYSHPWSWNEIGFGGPAYPRGYRNIGLDRREPWEVPDAHPDRDPVQVTRETEATRARFADRLEARQRQESRQPREDRQPQEEQPQPRHQEAGRHD